MCGTMRAMRYLRAFALTALLLAAACDDARDAGGNTAAAPATPDSDALNGFFVDVREGRVRGAYDRMSRGYRDAVPYAAFERAVASHPYVRGSTGLIDVSSRTSQWASRRIEAGLHTGDGEVLMTAWLVAAPNAPPSITAVEVNGLAVTPAFATPVAAPAPLPLAPDADAATPAVVAPAASLTAAPRFMPPRAPTQNQRDRQKLDEFR